jgi:dolichol-phosphate mannosyltransferase
MDRHERWISTTRKGGSSPLEAGLGQSGTWKDNAPLRKTAAVIPTYHARDTIKLVVAKVLEFVDLVFVVDDACPEHSSDVLAADDPRIVILRHETNRGVGAAVRTGISEAKRCGVDYIVKIDADDQMDVRYIPNMIAVLERFPDIDLVKGNRFAEAATLRSMPIARLVGNAGLTFLVKFSSGYWTLVDPTNGYLALRTEALDGSSFEKLDDRYFFEIDLLCWLGLRHRTIAEMEMPAIYGDEPSSLSITATLFAFPAKLLSRFLRRIILNYLILEINLASVCAVIGLPLLAFATAFGATEWHKSIVSGVSRPTGTIILALMLFMVGFQLLLQAFLYDVQFSTRTVKLRSIHRCTPLETPRRDI